jgi:hypothetical protein
MSDTITDLDMSVLDVLDFAPACEMRAKHRYNDSIRYCENVAEYVMWCVSPCCRHERIMYVCSHCLDFRVKAREVRCSKCDKLTKNEPGSVTRVEKL